MRFKFHPAQSMTPKRLIYHSEQYSFDVEPRTETGITSLVINDLQLEIDESGRILCAWGFCPYQNWKYTDSLPPSFTPGSLAIDIEIEIVPGVSHRLTKPGEWPIFVNSKAGWVCVGKLDSPHRANSVEFSTNSIAVLEDGLLKAIWLHPEQLPEAVKLCSSD